MTLEYLVNSQEDVNRILQIMLSEKKAVISKRILNDNCFMVTATIGSEGREAAHSLSDLNKKICEIGDCTVLTNGSAAYYNKVLFPVINDFERKLRKLLYSTSALKPNVEGRDTIANLEAKDFGQLFDILFKDSKYFERIKRFVCGKEKPSWSGYSQELLKVIDNEEENLLWDRLLTDDVPTLRKHFLDIRSIRNDVMHAHNIDKEEYLRSARLFKKVNEEIDFAIEKLADGAFVPDSYNQDIENAIQEENGVPSINMEMSELQKAYLAGAIARHRIEGMENELREKDPEKYYEYTTRIDELSKKLETNAKKIKNLQMLNNTESKRSLEIEIMKLEIENGHTAEELLNKDALLEAYLTETVDK